MEGYYKSYCCKVCNKEVILITEEVKTTVKLGKHISCSHCGSEKLSEEITADSFKQIMNHSAYKKIRGAIRQVR